MIKFIFSIFFGALLIEIGCWVVARPIDNGFPKGFFMNHAEVGYSGKAGWSGQVARIHPHLVSINSNGYRDDEWVISVRESRVLMIGSSALFGLGVEKEDRLSERITKYLDITVHNAGMYGYGSPQALLALRNFCRDGNYNGVLYFHEYKLTRDDFVKYPSRKVVDGELQNLFDAKDSVAGSLKHSWPFERIRFYSIRDLLAKFGLSPRYLYENYRGLENFDEQYFLNHYSSTGDENNFPVRNISEVTENIYAMHESASNCGAKFAVVFLPGPQENRYKKNEPATKKLLNNLSGKITVFDLRHVLPSGDKVLLHGLDYFNPNALDALAQNLSISLKNFLIPLDE